MAARFRIVIVGIKEIKARFSPEHFRLALIASLPAAFEPARAAIAAAAPRGETGKLARGIKIKIGQRRGRSTTVLITASVGYGHLVEFGHRMVVGGKVSRATTLGERLSHKMSGKFKGQVIGFVPAQPFARPAFQSQEMAISNVLSERLAEALGGR